MPAKTTAPSKRPKDITQRLTDNLRSVAGAAPTEPANATPSAAPQPPAPAPVPATNEVIVKTKPLKVTKTYSLNIAELDKIETAFDLIRSRGIRDVSKAAVVRAFIRMAKTDADSLIAETSSDKD